MLGLLTHPTVWSLACLALLLCHCSPEAGHDGLSQAVGQDRIWTRLYTHQVLSLDRQLDNLGIDVTGRHPRLGFVDIYALPAETEQVLAQFEMQILTHQELRLDELRSRGLSDYHDPAEAMQLLQEVEETYGHIAKRVVIETDLHEGRQLVAMKISDNVDQDEGEPTFLMDGQMHAREVMTSEVCLDAIQYLTSRYETDPAVKRWVDQTAIWIVPVVNPEGAHTVFHDYNMWRKNRNPRGSVDLNRNYAWTYRECNGSSSNTSNETYHGTGPASEPESQAMQQLMDQVRPMFYINYHSYGEIIFGPGNCGRLEQREKNLFLKHARVLRDRVETDNGQTGNWDLSVGGGTPGMAINHAYGAVGAIPFLFELNSAFQPNHAQYRDATVRRQRAAWQYLLDQTLDGPSIRGQVLDARTQEKLVAHYRFDSHPFSSGQEPLKTDASGRFGRALLGQQTLTVTFWAEGYQDAQHEIDVANGPVDLTIRMYRDTEVGCTLAADCSLAQVQSATCIDGFCEVQNCQAGFGDCNLLPVDGCEQDLRADPANCGACGSECIRAQAQTECQQGVCELLGCESGYADCNQDTQDGCEAFVEQDSNHCGACATICEQTDAVRECQQGQCVFVSCQPDYADCNHDQQDGCETTLVDNPTDCGLCGKTCEAGQVCIGLACVDCQDGNQHEPACREDLIIGGCQVVGVDSQACGWLLIFLLIVLIRRR